MGLDVIAYERIEWLGSMDGDHEADDTACVYPNDDFPTRADGLEAGWYRWSGRQHDFRAGSYSSYNWWRDRLAEMIGSSAQAIWQKPEPGPFVELIDFADNEGALGPATSRKLAADFADWADRAESFAATLGESAGYFTETYDNFRRAFEIAATGGAVQFC